jgi:hypothetical protein
MDGIDSQPSSLTSAVERVLTSSQRVLVDRIDLLRLEAREDIATAIRGGTLVLGGAILLLYGWIVVVSWGCLHAMGLAVSQRHAWCRGCVSCNRRNGPRVVRSAHPPWHPAHAAR